MPLLIIIIFLINYIEISRPKCSFVISDKEPSANISAITLFHISKISVSSFLTAHPTPSPNTPPEEVVPVNATLAQTSVDI